MVSFCRYFIDSKILDKVPSVFILLGLIFIVMQYTGCLLISKPTSGELQVCYMQKLALDIVQKMVFLPNRSLKVTPEQIRLERAMLQFRSFIQIE